MVILFTRETNFFKDVYVQHFSEILKDFHDESNRLL